MFSARFSGFWQSMRVHLCEVPSLGEIAHEIRIRALPPQEAFRRDIPLTGAIGDLVADAVEFPDSA